MHNSIPILLPLPLIFFLIKDPSEGKKKEKRKKNKKMKSGFAKNNKHSNSFDAKAAWAAAAHSKQSSSVFSAKLIIPFILILSFIYFLYNLSLFFTAPSCAPNPIATSNSVSVPIANSTTANASPPPPPRQPQVPNKTLDVPQKPPPAPAADATTLHHIVFGIAASAHMWDQRKEYIKIWWRPRQMRGYVWLDKPVRESKSRSPNLPVLKLSGNTSKIPYTNRQGTQFAIRISRIVSETYRLGLGNVRWFVMGDDDTVFIPDNLVRVLSKFDHTQPYYIGAQSESHIQNIYFSYSMAYGGGGFAISRPLAEALSKMQDACLRRYPALYGSDDRIQACMAELGVPLTKHQGFHQYDVYGDLLGLLASHPVAPLVSLHHLDVVQPIFPGMHRAAALRKLFHGPVRLDPHAVVQQSICYESEKRWTVSVSWGFVVQIVRGVMSPREMETPARTFLNWYRRADYTAYSMNTRPVARNPCQRPYFYYLSSARKDSNGTTVTEYLRHKEKQPTCKWNMEDPSAHVDRIIVHKKPDRGLWDRSPRRNCCRVTPVTGKVGKKTMSVDVGMCMAGEVSQI